MTETQQNNGCIVNDLIAVADWGKYYQYPKLSTLRQLIFKSDNADVRTAKGQEAIKFKKVVKKIGKRVYISISEFNKWFSEQNAQGI